MTQSKQSVLETLQANSKVRGKRVMNRTFIIKDDGDLEVKLSPQAVKCLELIFSLEKDEIKEMELVELFKEGSMVTKQDPYHVFQYYRKSLVEAGWIEIQD